MADGDEMVIGSWYNYATSPTFLSAKYSPVLWIDGSAGAETGIYGHGSTIGIHGDAGGIGVKGESAKVGVRGTARTGAATEILSAGNGVEGLSGSGIGVKGSSKSGVGVLGEGRPGVQGNGAGGGIGVVGVAGSAKGTGVQGQADGGTGVSGTVTTGTGVFGRAPQGIALWGQSATKQGVLGRIRNRPPASRGRRLAGLVLKRKRMASSPPCPRRPRTQSQSTEKVFTASAAPPRPALASSGNARTAMPATLKATSWSMGTSRRRGSEALSPSASQIDPIGSSIQ